MCKLYAAQWSLQVQVIKLEYKIWCDDKLYLTTIGVQNITISKLKSSKCKLAFDIYISQSLFYTQWFANNNSLIFESNLPLGDILIYINFMRCTCMSSFYWRIRGNDVVRSCIWPEIVREYVDSVTALTYVSGSGQKASYSVLVYHHLWENNNNLLKVQDLYQFFCMIHDPCMPYYTVLCQKDTNIFWWCFSFIYRTSQLLPILWGL